VLSGYQHGYLLCSLAAGYQYFNKAAVSNAGFCQNSEGHSLNVLSDGLLSWEHQYIMTITMIIVIMIVVIIIIIFITTTTTIIIFIEMPYWKYLDFSIAPAQFYKFHPLSPRRSTTTTRENKLILQKYKLWKMVE
jgi:hypothetical protein